MRASKGTTAVVALVLLLSSCGLAAPGSVTAQPTSLTFGNQVINTSSAPQSITITNSSHKNLRVDNVEASPSGIFTVSGWSGPVRVAAGGSLTVQVVFRPTAAEAYSGAVVFTSNNVSKQVALSGTGTTSASTVGVTVAPSTATVQVGMTQQFTAGITGTTNTAVSWSVNGVAGGNSTVGTISSAGLYTAPGTVPAGAVTVKATSVADSTKSASASVTISGQSVVAVTITPTAAVLQAGLTQQFTATVTGTSNTGVTWAVNGIAGGNTTVGTVSAAGLYTAPTALTTSTTVTLTARSVADTSKSASASINLSPTPQTVSVTINPTSASVVAGTTKQFAATVTGTTNTAINWQVAGVTGGNSTVGLISSTGLYTAPLSVPATNPVTVTARSAYDSTAAANSAVTVTASTSSNGKDYYISTSGSDSNDGSASHPWATIKHADTVIAAGAVVHVLPGTYTITGPGGNTVALRTSKSGTASARITFISDTRGAAKLVFKGGTYYQWQADGNYVDIMGFDITGDGRIGIELYGSNQRAIGNIVHNLPITACDSTGGAGIVSGNYAASNNEILANVVHDIGTPGACTSIQGIYYSMYGGHVQNNIVYRVAEWGISTWHAATNVQISNNLVFGNGAGILVGAGDSPGGVINDNTIVSNNIVYKNLSTAIREQGSTGTRNQYLNNLLFGNGGGVLLQNGNTAASTISADPVPFQQGRYGSIQR